ncbi:nucleoside triphosphate pyrophosphohydrolase family protein [Legionella quinlivanii]|uniref:hypothetical protein n=1 Tax=Legionella quinlivanii TaxID=45073 RepID=UPI002244EA73|nr:hypothetical protein [Legionella quinlivanii]MCW8449755.1 hypothetical protein [Legionella quinlivanii]
MTNKIISIGSEHNEYLAFGDDSQFKDTLAYAFIVIHSDKLEFVQSRIKRIKKIYRIPEHVPLHSRVLFSGNARDKEGLSHLNPYMIKNLIIKIIDLINRTPMYVRYATCSLKEHEDFFTKSGTEIELSDKDAELKQKLLVTPDPKGLLGLLAHFSLATPPEDPQIPGYDKCQIIISKDPTKVKLFGSQRRQAHYWSQGFSDIGSDGDTVYKMLPLVQEMKETLMLEIADIVSYICSHALDNSTDNKNLFFLEQLNRIKYWTRSRYHPGTPK